MYNLYNTCIRYKTHNLYITCPLGGVVWRAGLDMSARLTSLLGGVFRLFEKLAFQ